jgi:hypothetical protein
MKEFILAAIEKTEGQVLLVIWISYLAYRVWETYSKGRALGKALQIIEDALNKQYSGIVSKLEDVANLLR